MVVGKSPEEQELAGEELGFSFADIANKVRAGAQSAAQPPGLFNKFSAMSKISPSPRGLYKLFGNRAKTGRSRF